MATFSFLNTTVTCHPSWDLFFNDPAIQRDLEQIQKKINNCYVNNKITPQPSDIFKVFQMDLNECIVVILGQDPYPQVDVKTKKAAATGRAFEVGSMICWSEKGNASLRNILKLLHKNKIRFNKNLPPKSIKTVREDILKKAFTILPPHQLFSNWESQGVLLLNTALTCECGNTSKSNAHAEYWKNFTRKLISFIDTNSKNTVEWFLWGEHSKKMEYLILNGIKHCSKHPRLNGNDKGFFYYENHFNKVTSIEWLGKRRTNPLK